MNGWIILILAVCIVFTVIEVAVSMHGNTKQAYIAAEKELQHVRVLIETAVRSKKSDLLQRYGERQHFRDDYTEDAYGPWRTECPYGNTAETGFDPVSEQQRLDMEQQRLAAQRDMAFAWMSANEALRETTGQAESIGNPVQTDSTMFF